MGIVDTVKRICMEEAKRLTGSEVIAPLPVWDNVQGSMGVQIKAPKQMGPQACEVVSGFTLTMNELKQANSIRLKAAVAVSGMLHDVQVQIRPLQKLMDVAPEAYPRIGAGKHDFDDIAPKFLGKRHAD